VLVVQWARRRARWRCGSWAPASASWRSRSRSGQPAQLSPQLQGVLAKDQSVTVYRVIWEPRRPALRSAPLPGTAPHTSLHLCPQLSPHMGSELTGLCPSHRHGMTVFFRGSAGVWRGCVQALVLQVPGADLHLPEPGQRGTPPGGENGLFCQLQESSLVTCDLPLVTCVLVALPRNDRGAYPLPLSPR